MMDPATAHHRYAELLHNQAMWQHRSAVRIREQAGEYLREGRNARILALGFWLSGIVAWAGALYIITTGVCR